MRVLRKGYMRLLVLVVCITSVIPGAMPIAAQEASDVNLALNKPVTASNEYSTMPRSYLTDDDEVTRWSTEQAPMQWAYVDLGETMQMDYFSMIWESASVYAGDYNIYVSDDKDNWGTPVVARKGNESVKSEEILSAVASGRYVKLEVVKMIGYQSVSCRDFKVKYTEGKAPQEPLENVAQGKQAQASSIETDTLVAANAFDGDTTTRASRWSSEAKDAPHWLYVDLGETLNVKTVKLTWETRKATSYEIQVADTLSEPMNDTDWTAVKTIADRPANKNDKIILDEIVKARYVRLYIGSTTKEDPDGGVEWNSISLYEMEVYGGEPKEDVSEIGGKIKIVPPVKGDKKLQIVYPETLEYDITYNGTDYEHVVDEDLTIYEPIVDTSVSVSFKLVDKVTKAYVFEEIQVVIPGTYQKEATDNAAPDVLPELREWKGTTGTFTPSESSRAVFGDPKLKDVAEAFAKDYKEITGKTIAVVAGEIAGAQDFHFILSDGTKGLKDEGYLMEVGDTVVVEADSTTGAFWATRTILQSIKATSGIPKGITRDYPLYKVRGFILDVGRKTFTLDYLEQVVKEMSWYKLNDFQVHLNDNLIPLENYSSKGWDPMEAYSGFRLESDIKKGGNNGLNQADLTSTDVFYTKDEFRNFIEESRVYGVNIVPEIDTPAHSLALTKVRPDLRHGTYGRDNDHLNLTHKYDESVGFVKDIFNEYMGDDLTNPVFDKDTIVHVGADEYNANHEAFRKFSDDMLEFVQGTGRTTRIWGSLSQSRGVTPVRSKDVQMNLWNFGYANMDEMYESGFDLINCNDGNYYIVPNAGYYYDYLNNGTLYNLPINSIGGVTIPAGDKQMIGGAFAVWNDMSDYLDNGVSEYDVYDRIKTAIPLFGAKLWGKGTKTLDQALGNFNTQGSAPETNFKYEVKSNGASITNYSMDSLSDTSTNDYHLKAGVNASIKEIDYKNALQLNGDESYVSNELSTVGLGNDLRVKVKRTSSSNVEQILFESSYGSIKAVQKDTGKVGFTRENYDYSFDYKLPLNEWVELEFKNYQNKAELYVNGSLVDVLGDDERVEGRPLLATTMIPMERIGSKTNAFIGYVDDVRLSTNDTYDSTMKLDYAVWSANAILKEKDNAELKGLVNQAKEIFKDFNPEATDIQALVDQINAIIDATDFEKADYSRVNAYRNLVPADLSVFTDESVARLNNVLSSIRDDLAISFQDIVDGYGKQLEDALGGLVVKEKGNVNYIDNSRLSATASSFQDEGSNAAKVLDNNPNTMWHTKWSITTMPHWIDIQLDVAESVNGLTYLPRQTGTNGIATKYEIQVSADGVNYTKVKEGTLVKDNNEKVIEFDAVVAKNVRFIILEAPNGNGAAAEIKLHAANVAADVVGLNQLIAQADQIVNIGYTATSWDALQAVKEDAKILATSIAPDPNKVEVMKRELTSKMVSLLLKEKVNTTKLDALVEEVSKIDLSIYTDESATTLKNALKEAKDIDKNNTNQTEVDAAYNKLKAAKDGLVAKSTVNTDGLNALLDSASAQDLSKYTLASGDALKAVIAEARQLLSTTATQAQVDAMVLKLQSALNGLELKNPSEELEKTKLEDLIAGVENLDKTKYTPESAAELERVLAQVKTALSSATTQAEVQAAYDMLLNAINQLKLISSPSTTPGAGQNQPSTGDMTNKFGMMALLTLAGFVVYKKRDVLNKKDKKKA